MTQCHKPSIKRIKLPDHLRDRFDDMDDDVRALQAKYNILRNFITVEQGKLSIRAGELWIETMADMGLTGKWRYEDGFVLPVDEKLQN